MTTAPTDQEPARTTSMGWGIRIGFVLCLCLYAFLSVRQMSLQGVTVDERTYFNSGRVILREGWEQPLVRLHGPIPYYMNQAFVDEFPAGGYSNEADVLFRGRMGTLPFGLLGLCICFLWSRKLFGPVGGLVSAAMFATSPVLISFGGLLAVDIIHSATILTCLFLLWRYLERPSLGRLGIVGVALGLAFATKYLSLLNGPVVVIIAATSAAWRARDLGRAQVALRWLGSALLLSVLAVGTLHATYGFKPGFASLDPGDYDSELVAKLIDLPVAGPLIATFPSAYLLGVDYQMTMGESNYRPYADGRYALGHKDFYLRLMFWRTPEWTLLIFAWLLLWKLPRWLTGRGYAGERSAAWVLVPPIVVALIYLNLFTSLQMGMRYILPLYPMLFVLCGSIATLSWVRRTPRLAGSLAAVVLLFQAYDLRANWPNLLGYFNHMAGGQANSYLHFRGADADWGQLVEPGLALLKETEELPFHTLSLFEGPRFGRVAIKVRDFVQPDPEDPSRARHWLFALTFERHVGGAWRLFDVTREAFEAAAEKDERVRIDLISAFLGAGEFDAARAHLEQLSPERAGPVAERIEALDSDSQVLTDVMARVTHWRAIGRHDHVERESAAVPEQRARVALLADALTKQNRVEEAIEVFVGLGDAIPSKATVYLANLYVVVERYDDAVAALENFIERANPPGDSPPVLRLETLRAEAQARQRFRDALR